MRARARAPRLVVSGEGVAAHRDRRAVGELLHHLAPRRHHRHPAPPRVPRRIRPPAVPQRPQQPQHPGRHLRARVGARMRARARESARVGASALACVRVCARACRREALWAVRPRPKYKGTVCWSSPSHGTSRKSRRGFTGHVASHGASRPKPRCSVAGHAPSHGAGSPNRPRRNWSKRRAASNWSKWSKRKLVKTKSGAARRRLADLPTERVLPRARALVRASVCVCVCARARWTSEPSSSTVGQSARHPASCRGSQAARGFEEQHTISGASAAHVRPVNSNQ